MSSDPAIAVRQVSKCYPIYEKPHHRLLQGLFRQRRTFYREFWALRDVSFEVAGGETVGIVGRNGSGKSTLLQIIAGTLAPTQGNACVTGSIAALLELGSGFNPDFTGRENVYLNASLLGLKRDDIDNRFDDIAAFAGIGDFLDQPLRVYSSGMAVRLAFSVAINVRPSVLIVDEALAVGDEAFQRKCYARIHDFRDHGGTILFVSHSGTAVVELCDRALVLDSGEKIFEGEPKKAIAHYQKLIYAPADRAPRIRAEIQGIQFLQESAPGPESTLPTDRTLGEDKNNEDVSEFFDPNLLPKSTVEYARCGAAIQNPQILTPEGRQVNVLVTGRDYVYVYEIHFTEPAIGVRCGAMFKTMGGFELGGLITHGPGAGVDYIPAGSVYQARFPFRCLLLPGVYFLNSGVVGSQNSEEVFLHRIHDLLMFRVAAKPVPDRAGVIDLSSSKSPTLSISGTPSLTAHDTSSEG